MKKQLMLLCFLLVGVLAVSAQNVTISRAYADSTFNVCGTGLFKVMVSGATPINFTLELDSAADRVSFISVIDSSSIIDSSINNDSTIDFTVSSIGTFYYRVKFDCAAMSTSSGTVNIAQQVKVMGTSLASTSFNVNTYTLLRPAPASLSMAGGDRATRELLFAVSGNAPYRLDSNNSVFEFNYRTPAGILIDSVIVDYYNNQTIVNSIVQPIDDTICSFKSTAYAGSFTADTIRVRLILKSNTCNGANAYLNYSYGCSLLDNCKVDSLEDAININPANNRLTITKLNCPTDTSCYAPLDTVQWMYKIANNNSFSLNNVFLQLYLDETIWKHAFSFIDYNSITILKNNDPLTIDTNTSAIKFQVGGYQQGEYRPECLTTSLAQGAAPIYALRYPKGTFLNSQFINGDTLQPGDSYIIKFSTYRCCASDSIEHKDYTSQGVYLNHWQLQCTGNNLCTVLTRAISDTLCGGLYNNGIIVSQISEEGRSGPDFKLEQDYSPAASDLYVASQGVCDTTAALRERITAINYQLDTTSLMHDRGLYERVGNGFKVMLKVSLQAALGLKPFDDDVPQSPTSSNEFYLSYNAINYNAIQTNFTDLGSNGSMIIALFDLEFNNATLFNNFMSNFTVHYALYPCCPAEAVPGYSITTYINPKPSYCDTCFIPLSRKENAITIHCPGCLLPGIESVNYTLLRMPGSYGWLDDAMVSRQNGKAWINGSGAAEKINPLAYPGVFNLNKSIVGDTLEGKLIAYFNDGTSNAYHQLTAAAYDSTHPNDPLRYFYIEQFIPEGDSLHYNVSPFSNGNYLHRLFITSVNDTGTLFFNITDSAQFQVKDTTNGRLFTYRFDKDAISNAIGRTYTLHDGDNYLLYNYFTVCGNPVQGDLWNNNMDPVVNTSSDYEVRNSMYLSGISTVAPGTSLIGNAEKATELYSLLCNPQQPDTCNIPADSLRPEWLYNCGNSSGFHFFYSVPSQVRVVSQNTVNGTNSCMKRIIIEESSAIGGYNNSGNGLSLGRILNVFNNEVRPIRPSGFHAKINTSLPIGYEARFSNHQGGFMTRGSCNGINSGFTRLRSLNDSTVSGNSVQHVSMPFDLATDSSYSTLACNGDTTITAPSIMLLGDEHYYHNYNLFLVPNCPLASGTSLMAISNISINRGTPGCGTIDTSTLIALTGYSPDSLEFSLPTNAQALEIAAIPTATYDGVTNTYCHSFDISNAIPGFTANYPWLYIPANANVSTVTSVTADTIFQDLDSNNTVLGYWIHLPAINSQAPLNVAVCYSTPCLTDSVAYQLPFYYGWHCTSHPIGIDPMSTCDYQTDTFNFTTPSISLRLPKSIPLQPDTITLCGANNFTACISSEQSQGLRSVIYYLILPVGMEYVTAQLSDTNWQIASVDTHAVGCNDTNAIAITAVPKDSTAQLNLNETLCLTYTITTTCAYGGSDLPTTCISGTSYCGNTVDSALTQTYQAANQVVDSCVCAPLVCATDTFEVGIDYNFSNDRISNLWPAGSITTNQMIYIEDTLVMDKNFSFINCPNIYLGTDAVIYVLTGVTLVIDSSTLQSCGAMWQGIILESDVALTVQSGSLIKDAQKAIANSVNSLGGGLSVNIYNSIFDQNNISISMQALSASLTITGSTFTHSSSDHLLHRSPLAGQEGFAHIELNGLTNTVNVGDINAQRNYFSYGLFGILANVSSVSIIHNNFSEFVSHCPPPPLEDDACALEHVCILATGNSRQMVELKVGEDSLPLGINEFVNCSYGIVSRYGVTTRLSKNKFNNINYGGGAADIAVWSMQQDSGFNQTVIGNRIDSYFYGVNMYHQRHNELMIANNTIRYRPNIVTNNITDVAIVIRNDSYDRRNNPEVSILENVILGRNRGVLLTALNKANVKANYITLPSSQSTRMMYGIRLQNNRSTTVVGNQIARSQTPLQMEELMILGITSERGGNNILLSNQLQNMGTSIRFFNTRTPNSVNCNTMIGYRSGITLEESNIDSQGDSLTPSDNQWYRTLPTTNIKGIYQGNPPAPPPVWWVQNVGNFNPAPWIDPPGFIVPINTPNSSGCNDPCTDPGCEQQLLWGMLTDEQQSVVMDDETRKQIQYYIFNELNSKPNLKAMGTTRDSILKVFYDYMLTTNYGKLLNVQEVMMADSDTVSAVLINTTIQANNNEEYYQQLYNELYLNQLVGYDSAARTALGSIALENPISGGEAVYDARVALMIDADDYTSFSALRQSGLGMDGLSNSVKVYPNPTKGSLLMVYNLNDCKTLALTIKNVEGRELQIHPLSCTETEKYLSLESQPSGIYLLHLYLNGSLLETIKIIKQ